MNISFLGCKKDEDCYKAKCENGRCVPIVRPPLRPGDLSFFLFLAPPFWRVRFMKLLGEFGWFHVFPVINHFQAVDSSPQTLKRASFQFPI